MVNDQEIPLSSMVEDTYNSFKFYLLLIQDHDDNNIRKEIAMDIAERYSYLKSNLYLFP